MTFENGSVGTLEATRFAHGHRNGFQWEINGTTGALAFDLERLNEFRSSETTATARVASGRSLVSEADHPFWQHWWPPGHIIGWGDTFVHELHHFLNASRTTPMWRPTAPHSRTATGRRRSATPSSDPARAERERIRFR